MTPPPHIRNKKIAKFAAKWVKATEALLTYEDYRNGGTALVLHDSDVGDASILTVWIEGLAHDEVAVKDYSEGEGVLNELIRLKIVNEPHRFEQPGFVNLPICKLRK